MNISFNCGALSRKKAAEYLAISTRKLDQLASSGEIPKGKHGTKTFFRITDLESYLGSKIDNGGQK